MSNLDRAREELNGGGAGATDRAKALAMIAIAEELAILRECLDLHWASQAWENAAQEAPKEVDKDTAWATGTIPVLDFDGGFVSRS